MDSLLKETFEEKKRQPWEDSSEDEEADDEDGLSFKNRPKKRDHDKQNKRRKVSKEPEIKEL